MQRLSPGYLITPKLYINGEKYEEDYLNEEMRDEDTELFTVQRVIKSASR